MLTGCPQYEKISVLISRIHCHCATVWHSDELKICQLKYVSYDGRNAREFKTVHDTQFSQDIIIGKSRGTTFEGVFLTDLLT